MRKDSILQNYYFEKFPKNKTKDKDPIDKSGKPSLNKIIEKNSDKTSHISKKQIPGLSPEEKTSEYDPYFQMYGQMPENQYAPLFVGANAGVPINSKSAVSGYYNTLQFPDSPSKNEFGIDYNYVGPKGNRTQFGIGKNMNNQATIGARIGFAEGGSIHNGWLGKYATGGPGDEQDWGTAGNAAWTAAQIADPTGVLSYGDAYRGWRDMVNEPSLKNFGWALLNTAAALPVVGEGARIAKLGAKAGKTAKEWKELKALEKVGRAANKTILRPIATIDKGVGAGHIVGSMTAKAIENAPKAVKIAGKVGTDINRGTRWGKLMEPVGEQVVNGIGWGLNKVQDITQGPYAPAQKYGGQPCYNCGGMYGEGGDISIPDLHEGWLNRYDGGGLVDFLTKSGKPSDKASRAKLATSMGIKNYTGTAEQNNKLLALLSSKPAVKNESGFDMQAKQNPYVVYPSPANAPSVPYFPKVVASQPATPLVAAAAPVKKVTPRVVTKEEGLAAIHAFNQNNPNAIQYENKQQAVVAPKKTKHTFQDLKQSIAAIPQNETAGLPMNVSNYLKNHFAPNSNMSLTTKDLSDDQKLILWQTIQAAQKRNKGALSGGADYIDYPTEIGRSAQGFMDNPTNLPDYIRTPEGQLSTTLGGFTYNQDPTTGEYIVTDKYNFSNARNESRKNKQGKGLMGKLRKKADEDEAKNLAGQSDTYWGAGANRRVGINLTASEIEKIKNRNKAILESNLIAANKYVDNPSFFKKLGGEPNWLGKYIK